MAMEMSPSTIYERAEHAARTIRARCSADVSAALVLGSGLGAFADELQDATAIPYRDIPGFAQSTVEGHASRLVIGKAAGVNLAAMQGRFHYYEGYSPEEVTFPIRVLKLLGARTLILTNAAGAVNVEFSPGSLMIITDHVNMMGVNPLAGPNDERFGPRFPDLTDAYSRRLQEIAMEEAGVIGLQLRRGIYAGLLGPSYETPAEIRMVRTAGADAVGMSTVPEVITARHMGMEVLGISCITNLAAGVAEQPIDHHAVVETGERVRVQFTELLRRVIARLDTGN